MARLPDLAFSCRSRVILRDLVVSRSAVRGSRSNSDHDPFGRASSVEIIRIRRILTSCNKKNYTETLMKKKMNKKIMKMTMKMSLKMKITMEMGVKMEMRMGMRMHMDMKEIKRY